MSYADRNFEVNLLAPSGVPSWFTELTVEPNTDYLFTAWIRTELSR